MKRAVLIAALLITATLNAQRIEYRWATPLPVAPKVNINTATIAQLCYLPGIGKVMAQRIVNYRTEHGQFRRVSDLLQVKGIGAKKLAAVQPFVTLSGATTASAKIGSSKGGAK